MSQSPYAALISTCPEAADVVEMLGQALLDGAEILVRPLVTPPEPGSEADIADQNVTRLLRDVLPGALAVRDMAGPDDPRVRDIMREVVCALLFALAHRMPPREVKE